jgi:hypothetical protein
MSKIRSTVLACFFVICLIANAVMIHAQNSDNISDAGALNSVIANESNKSDEYYFTDAEFSEEFNFTNESISNIVITVPADYQYVDAGMELLTSIKIINLGSRRREDVVLDFEIKDLDNNLLLAKKETVAVETQANFVRIFPIPKDAKAGQYMVHVTLAHANGKNATASAYFEVKDAKAELMNQIYIAAGALVLLVLILLFAAKSGKWIDRFKLRRKIHKIVKARMKANAAK